MIAPSQPRTGPWSCRHTPKAALTSKAPKAPCSAWRNQATCCMQLLSSGRLAGEALSGFEVANRTIDSAVSGVPHCGCNPRGAGMTSCMAVLTSHLCWITGRVIAGMHLGKGGGNNSGRVHAQVGSNVASHRNACTSIDPGQHLSQQCPDAAQLVSLA